MQVVVGRVGRAHGIRGDVSVDLRTDDPDRRFAVGVVLHVEGSRRALTIRATRAHHGRLLVDFAEVADRTAAEQLSGAVLVAEVDPTETPDDPEEFYDHQLVGLAARTSDGEALGEVVEVLHLPDQDTLVIRRDGADGTGSSELLVPFVAALVVAVDLGAGTLDVVSDVVGLLDPDAAETADPGR